jgi:DNA-binding transcriptional MerR regulator
MDKHRAIPQGFMTVGEIAKKMGVTVRTLQYYDKEGVLSPSAESEGGRRLYTYKDIVTLHQIQSMKYLGFSLEDIRTRLPSINTPGEVSATLTKQAKEIREKIKSLIDVQESLEKLNAEVLQMETVNWKRYADIVVLLQNKSDGYWALKYFSDSTVDNMRQRFDAETGELMLKRYKQVIKKSAKIQKAGHKPESEQGQAIAKEWWGYVLEFTQGDMSLLAELINIGENMSDIEWERNFSFSKGYLEEALGIYFTSIGYNPFEPKGEST